MLLYLCASLSILTLFTVKRIYALRTRLPLPPGPRGWPIIGNLFDMPQDVPWRTFSHWGREYGEISSVTVFGQPVIVLNSVKAATELIGNKGKLYADRPELLPPGNFIGWKCVLPILKIGETFRLYRKLWHQESGTHAAIQKYHAFEETAMRTFLRGLEQTPQDFLAHSKTHITTVALGTTYGYKVRGAEDEAISIVELAMKEFSAVTAPGFALVSLVPVLRYLPKWLPFGDYIKKRGISVAFLDAVATPPYDAATRQIEAGQTDDCFLASAYKPSLTREESHNIKWLTATMAASGFTTRLSAFHGFFLIMALNPEAQRMAQTEIDHVVGTDRLPNFKDRERLPYVNALCRELSRFHPVVPTGLPHLALEDDVYNGYSIPKGSLVIANIGNMLHDPETYSNPDIFNPSRFLSSEEHVGERDIYDFLFGFGRRSCPGKVVADTSLFILAAMALAVFDISKFVDANGVTVEPVMKPLNGSVSHLEPFKCSVKPRSVAALALIMSHADGGMDECRGN
ncbi:O-methylsterigmatocystin oxidoreductase [Hypsizygus marmoreus]|uniref:O-methylsterigmatocystin oxidoreductase n=1 Tax=Hypsizygus marmoreus TaxID=39966 RepID=A0A369JAP6_HYPMA|nr:O-methylsterigmatocystin oxidoreductase [Hypsizygus marmoreus]